MASPISPELQSKLSIWRQKASEGTLSMEELREAVAFLRSDRKAAASTSTAKKNAKAKVAIPDADTLMKELGL